MILEEASEDDPFMCEARRMAESSNHKRFKMGAVLVKRGKVIARGNNSYRTHPRWGNPPFGFMHAEGNCFYDSQKNNVCPHGATLYVYRSNGNLAKPCPQCQRLIQKQKIRKVIYSA